MPEGYTHIRTAQRAAAAVRYKIKCPAAFAAGANGPDTFFCYQAWKPARKRLFDLPALGRRLHGEKTGPFLRSLVSHVRTVPQIEYAMGFLSHYAADTVIHPYVEALCRPGMPYAKKGGHGYFEAALDTLLHEQDTGSKGAVPPADSAPVLAGEALADVASLLHTCLQEVYGLDVPVEYLADSFHHNTVLRGLFTSRFGVRRAFYWLIEPLFAGRGYITGHVTPRKLKPNLPDAWTDPFSGEARSGDIFALLAQAQSRSEKYMAATILAWGGQLSSQALAGQLGSMSYLEGRSTAQSDPDFVPPEPERPERPAPPAPAETEPAAGTESAEAAVEAAPPEPAEMPETDEMPEIAEEPKTALPPEPAEAPEPGAQASGTAPELAQADPVNGQEGGAENAAAEAAALATVPTAESGEEQEPPDDLAAELAAAARAEEEKAELAEADPEPPPVTVLELPPTPADPAPAWAGEKRGTDDPAGEAPVILLPAADDTPDTAVPEASVSQRLKQMLQEDPSQTDIPPEQAPEALSLPEPDPDAPQDTPQEGDTV